MIRRVLVAATAMVLVGAGFAGTATSTPVGPTASSAAPAGLAAAKEVAGGGMTGTLTALAAAPDGTIYGADDRGVWRLETDGWRLLRPVDYAPTPGSAILEAQFSRWPGALSMIPRRSAPAGYVIVAADGAGTDVVRSDDGGATWTTVDVKRNAPTNGIGVGLLCYAPLDAMLESSTWATTLFAYVDGDVFMSDDAGATWAPRIQDPGTDPMVDPLWPSDCDMGYASPNAMHDLKASASGTTTTLGGAGGVALVRKGVEYFSDPTPCPQDAVYTRAASSGDKVLVVSSDGCYATATFRPNTGTFSEWSVGTVVGVGPLGAISSGYYETPSEITAFGDTAYLATETGVFAYSWSQDTWFPAARGIPMHTRSPIPSQRAGSWIIAGGYQGESNVLGLFSSTDDGATFTRMKGVPAGVEMRYLSQAGETRAYILDEDPAFGTYNLYRTDDAGTTWTRTNGSAFEWAGVLGMTATGSEVYLASYAQSLYDCCRYDITVQVSSDAGATFSPIDTTVCDLGDPFELTSFAMTERPGGGIVVLDHTRSSSALKGCTIAAPTHTPVAVAAPGVTANYETSLLTYRDSLLWAYPAQGGLALTSTDGSVWTECTPSGDLVAPPGLQSITRDSASSLVGIAIDPANGSRIVRSLDGCGWDTGTTDLADAQLDMTSMVLPEDGEIVASEDNPDEAVIASTLTRVTPRAAKSTRVITLRAIGPGAKGSIVKSVRFGPAPGAPIKKKASVAKGKITLQVTPPTTVGGGIVGYTATCTAPKKPARTAISKTSTIVIEQLAAKTTYSCKVTARDAAGPGAALTWQGLRTP